MKYLLPAFLFMSCAPNVYLIEQGKPVAFRDIKGKNVVFKVRPAFTDSITFTIKNK